MDLVWDAAVAVASVIALALALFSWRRSSGVDARIPQEACLPPGPRGLPLVGDVATFLGNLTPQKAFAWSQTHGPVIRIKAGFAQYIILNDLDSIKRFLNHKDILYRCRSFAFSDSLDIGFARYEGKLWDENRRFSLKVLRDIGFGKAAMKDAFQEGCDRLVNRIAESQGHPIDLSELILTSVSDNIGMFVFGRRYSFGHHEHKHLSTALRNEFIASRDASALDSLPAFITTLARLVPFTRAAKLLAAVRSIQAFVSRHLPYHVVTYRDRDAGDFMDAYLRKCDEGGHDTKSRCSMSSLIGNAGSLVLAGGNTVSAVLVRLLLLLAINVDTVQNRIHREIDNFIGSERRPTWEDRHLTPYTLATIWEAHRWNTLLPLGAPRRAFKDVVIGKHFVPKDTTIIGNIWAVHKDPVLWNEPEKFNPARFLKEDGTMAWEKAEKLIPFSVGKRMCPAEIFASVEIYIYLARLMQKFFILPEEGAVFDASIPYKHMMQPGRHKFRCMPRAPSLP